MDSREIQAQFSIMHWFSEVANKILIDRSYSSNCHLISLIGAIGQVNAHNFAKKFSEVQAFFSFADGTFRVD